MAAVKAAEAFCYQERAQQKYTARGGIKPRCLLCICFSSYSARLEEL